VNTVRLFHKPEEECYAYIRIPEKYQPEKETKAKVPPVFDISIIYLEGNVCILLEGFVFAPLNRKSIIPKKHARPGTAYYVPVWEKTEGSPGQ